MTEERTACVGRLHGDYKKVTHLKLSGLKYNHWPTGAFLNEEISSRKLYLSDNYNTKRVTLLYNAFIVTCKCLWNKKVIIIYATAVSNRYFLIRYV